MPTPIASDFEVRFAQQFHDYVEHGGSPNVESYPAALHRKRLLRWLAVAGVAATALSVVVYLTLPSSEPALHWSQNAVAAWITAALLLAIPFTIVVVVSQVRLSREITLMQQDRARYAEYRRQRLIDDDETSRRLRDLGIDL